jgi:hypothetical protein
VGGAVVIQKYTTVNGIVIQKYTILDGDPTVICIDGYVAFDVRVALSHSKYTAEDAEKFASKVADVLNIVALLNEV